MGPCEKVQRRRDHPSGSESECLLVPFTGVEGAPRRSRVGRQAQALCQTCREEPMEISKQSLNRFGNPERDWGWTHWFEVSPATDRGLRSDHPGRVPGRRDRNLTNTPTNKWAEAESEEEQPGVFKL